jgi:hypothetical protein
VVTLHAEGWTSKAISGYLRVHKSTVHRIPERWAFTRDIPGPTAQEGPEKKKCIFFF